MIPLMKITRRGIGAALLTATLSFAGTAPAAHALSSEESLRQLSSLSSALLDVLPSLVPSTPGTPSVPGVPGAPSLPGITASTTTRTITAGGLNRRYTVVIPAGYTPARAYPVIIGYGGWQHSADQARGYQKFETAAGNRAIIVYAHGIQNAWGGAPYAATSVGQDVQYTRAIVDDLASAYTINRSRIYAAGLSNGGGMAAAVACKAPDLIAAWAGVAGAYYNPTVQNCNRGRVRTLIMHADNDDIVNYRGGTRHGAPYRAANSVYYDMGLRNGCNMNGAIDRRVGNTTEFTPPNAGACTETKIVKVHGGGHTWFPSPNATTEVVNFFLR